MPDWQKREEAQNKFIEKLAHAVEEAAENSGNRIAFIGEFLIALLRSIVSMAEGSRVRDKTEAENLRDDIITKMEQFVRIEGELTYLIGSLHEKLWNPIASFSQQKYQHNCIANPEKSYGAGSRKTAMRKGRQL